MAKLIDVTGKALSGEWGMDDIAGNGVPVLRTTNFTNEGIINYDNIVTRRITKKNIGEKYLRKGDIIIEKSGGSDKFPVGRVVYFDGDENTYLFNNFTGLLRVKNKEEWYPKYIFYSLFANYKRGGTRPFENKTTGLHNLKIDDYVTRYEVTALKKEEQISICEKIDRIYRIIKLREQELQLLDELIKARFIELFGDPKYNDLKWPIYMLGELFTIGSSKRIYQSDQVTEGVPFLRISDLINKIEKADETFNLFISEELYAKLKENKLVPVAGDILVTSRGTLGRCYEISEQDEFYFQDGMISWLYDRDEKITNTYLMHLFQMPGFRLQIDEVPAGSTVNYLSIARMKNLRIMCPSIELQQQFADFVAQVDKSKVVA